MGFCQFQFSLISFYIADMHSGVRYIYMLMIIVFAASCIRSIKNCCKAHSQASNWHLGDGVISQPGSLTLKIIQSEMSQFGAQ